MKCSSCNKNFADDLKECPFCHTPNELFELPKLKEKDIVSHNEEIIKEEEKNITKEERLEDDVFSSNNNVKKRKSFFFKVILVTLVLCLGLFLFFYFKKNLDTNINYDEELDNYYSSYNTSDAKELLEVINNKEDIIIEVQTKTKDKLNEDIDIISRKQYSNRSLLLEELNKIKEDVNNLYDVYVLNKKKDKVKVLSNDNYNELIMKLDQISKDSDLYYEIINLYNDKDYDEVAKVAKLVKETNKDNYYYEEIIKYIELSTNDVLKLIEKDIEKMTQGIELLNEQAKEERYNQIYLVIETYNNLYINLKLSNNSKYQELLNNYKK